MNACVKLLLCLLLSLCEKLYSSTPSITTEIIMMMPRWDLVMNRRPNIIFYKGFVGTLYILWLSHVLILRRFPPETSVKRHKEGWMNG